MRLPKSATMSGAPTPAWLPERLRFANFVDGRPKVLVLSGRVMERRDT